MGVAAYLRSSSASSASLRLPGSAARRKGETPQVNSNGHYHHGNHRPIIHFFLKGQAHENLTQNFNEFDQHTDKKENKVSLIYQEIQMGSGAKSYMRKGLLIYEGMHKYFHHNDEVVSHI